MKEQLQQLAEAASERGLGLALEHDHEFGWICGFRSGDQWMIVVSSWSESPEQAVADAIKRFFDLGKSAE
jgi:uncharacterized protein (DUF2237 family)